MHNGGGNVGKIDDKKKQKRDSLLGAAFSLFTSQGINDTSISDIVKKANMAKGTFYLYFKDKFDIRDKLITSKATQLFFHAAQEMKRTGMADSESTTLEDAIIFIADSMINDLNEDKRLLRFISKNLSWGVFHNLLVTSDEENGYSFYDGYEIMLEKSGRRFRNPELMLYMIVELINSTCHNVILDQEPVTLAELKPELYNVIRDIIHRQEIAA